MYSIAIVGIIHMIKNQRRTWMFGVLFYRKENIIFKFNKETNKNNCEKLARKDGCGDYLSNWRDCSSAAHHYERKEETKVC